MKDKRLELTITEKIRIIDRAIDICQSFFHWPLGHMYICDSLKMAYKEILKEEPFSDIRLYFNAELREMYEKYDVSGLSYDQWRINSPWKIKRNVTRKDILEEMLNNLIEKKKKMRKPYILALEALFKQIKEKVRLNLFVFRNATKYSTKP